VHTMLAHPIQAATWTLCRKHHSRTQGAILCRRASCAHLHVEEMVERADFQRRRCTVHLDTGLRSRVHHQAKHVVAILKHAASQQHLIHGDGHYLSRVLLTALDVDAASEVVQVAVWELCLHFQLQVQHIIWVLQRVGIVLFLQNLPGMQRV
jgi:hypothetical protein